MVASKSTSGGYCHVQQTPSQSPSPVSAASSPAVNPGSSPGAVTAYVTPAALPGAGAGGLAGGGAGGGQKPASLSMQLAAGGLTLLPSGGEAQNILNYMQGLPPGTPISLPVTQASNAHQQQQAVYRFPTPQPGQIVSLQGIPQAQAQNLVKVSESTTSSTSSSSHVQQQQVTMIQGNSQTPMMYQTPQGLVYAAAAGSSVGTTLSEGFIVNLPQQSAGGQQQYITIPVPLSLAHGAGTQMFQPVLTQAGTPTMTPEIQRSPMDRTVTKR